MFDKKKTGHKLRVHGERDALADKPINAFLDIPNIRHSESERASYEIGYRAAKDNFRKAGHRGEIACQWIEDGSPAEAGKWARAAARAALESM